MESDTTGSGAHEHSLKCSLGFLGGNNILSDIITAKNTVQQHHKLRVSGGWPVWEAASMQGSVGLLPSVIGQDCIYLGCINPRR